MVQYWRTMDQLLAYAKNRDATHLPAGKAFNKKAGLDGNDAYLMASRCRSGPCPRQQSKKAFSTDACMGDRADRLQIESILNGYLLALSIASAWL
jgi:hypothetical protein